MSKQTSEQSKIKAVHSILSGDQSVLSISKLFKVSRSTVYRWLDKNDKEKSLARKPVSGRPPKIDLKSGKKLLKIISKSATDYGFDSDFWTTRRLQQVIKKELKIEVSRVAISQNLKKFECSYRKPETRYYETNTKEQKEWRKKVVPKINRLKKKHNAILYFEDESCIQLSPVVAKTWGLVGEKIIKQKTGNRGSVSAISAISSSGHLLFNVDKGGKRYRSEDIIGFLTKMLDHHSRRHLIVVMDQARCHTSKKVKEFIKKQKRLHVFYLPPRSPELNPDEKIWNHLKNQEMQSHTATNLTDLKKLTKQKLLKMSKNKKQLMGIYRMCEASTFFD